MNSNNRIAATLLPRDIVCLRNISINTLHEGDDDDDDNYNNNTRGDDTEKDVERKRCENMDRINMDHGTAHG